MASIQEDIALDWVFGYGSIMNNLSRNSTGGGEMLALLCRLKPSFGMVRCWNFRSSTGFTAVGLRRRAEQEPEASICGVLFPASGSMAAFDLRERGYERLQLQLSDLEFPDLDGSSAEQQRILTALHCGCVSADVTKIRFWIYSPLVAFCKAPSEDYPICQSYVDCVLQGCLAWGGIDLAREWVATTSDWSPFFLNDAPLSRRPWLHRERHAEIDEVLAHHAEWSHFAERRHPEEFASHWMLGLRGMCEQIVRNTECQNAVAEPNIAAKIITNIGTDDKRAFVQKVLNVVAGSICDLALEAVCNQMRNAVPIKDRSWMGMKYKACANAPEMLDWLERQPFCGSRQAAVALCVRLQKLNAIIHVWGSKKLRFADTTMFFRFPKLTN